MASPSPAQHEDAAGRADRLLFAALGVAALGFAVLFIGFEYGRDQGIYATVAGVIARGGAPYLDAWDFKPPAIFAVYAAARGAFGPGMLGVRVLELVALLSLVPAFAALSRRAVGSPRPGVLAAFVAFYAQYQLEYWNTGQPESFGGVAVVWALVLAARAEDADSARARTRAALGTGALYALAGLFKPHLGAGLVVSVGFLCAAARRSGRPPWPPLFACGLGACGVLAACVAWLALSGAGPATIETFAVFLPAYHELRFEAARLPLFLLRSLVDVTLGYTAYLPTGLVLLALLPPLASRERRALLQIGGVLALQLLGIAYQARFYPYHFGASLTLLALPAGWGLWKAWCRVRFRPLGPALAVLALVVLAVRAPAIPTYGAADFWQRVGLRARLLFDAVDARAVNLLHTAGDVHYGANRRVADWLAAQTPPDSAIYVWGFEPMLYELAERRPASRWIYNVPQRLDWEHRARARAELLDDLIREPPSAIVLVEHDAPADVTGSLRDGRAELEAFPELRAFVAEGYRRAFQLEDLEVYLAND